MESKELKAQSMKLFEAIYDASEEQILAHIDDKEHQSFGGMAESIAESISANVNLVKEIARTYVVSRGDMDIARGRSGGLKWIDNKPAEKVAPIVPAIIPESVKEIQKAIEEIKVEEKKEDIVETIEKDLNDLSEAIKSLEPEKKEEKKEEEKKELGENEFPAWCVAEKDPMQSRINNKRVWK